MKRLILLAIGILCTQACGNAQQTTRVTGEDTMRLGKKPVWDMAEGSKLELMTAGEQRVFVTNGTELYTLTSGQYVRNFAISRKRSCILLLISDEAVKPQSTFVVKLLVVNNKWSAAKIFEHINGRLPNSTEWISEVGAVDNEGTVGIFKYSGVTRKGLSHGPMREQIWRKVQLVDGKILEDGLFVD